jgi:trehalose-6-phosphate hydrolase
MVEQGDTSHDDMMAILRQKSRDNSRTPMQWNDSKHAGFTQGTPWIGVAENYPQINAEAAVEDEQSVFYFYKELIALRKQLAVITDGSYVELFPEHTQVHGYLRESEDAMLLCLNNYYGEETSVVLPEQFDGLVSRAVLSNCGVVGEVELMGEVVLKPYETLVLLVDKN